ncbi:hypothetical protein B194_3391 [Serratia plymuthica A30]|nr:hypothetical protein B194_3391 [Serratia plymuthica A30]
MQGVREYSACSTAHFDEPQSQQFKKLSIEDQVKESAGQKYWIFICSEH